MSESYGACELAVGTTGNQFFSQFWQQAAAQGITVFLASGDSGSAVCDRPNSAPPVPAQHGLQVSGFSSTPYNVSVGGTDFYDWTTAATYWNVTNDSATKASVKGYIPETTWNDTCTNAVFGVVLGFSTDAERNCNNSRLREVAVQNGASPVTFSSTPCAGLPVETTCSVAPSTVDYTSLVQIDITTTGTHPLTVGKIGSVAWLGWLGTTLGSMVLGSCWLSLRKGRDRFRMLGLIVAAFLVATTGCGGGGSGGGGVSRWIPARPVARTPSRSLVPEERRCTTQPSP